MRKRLAVLWLPCALLCLLLCPPRRSRRRQFSITVERTRASPAPASTASARASCACASSSTASRAPTASRSRRRCGTCPSTAAPGPRNTSGRRRDHVPQQHRVVLQLAPVRVRAQPQRLPQDRRPGPRLNGDTRALLEADPGQDVLGAHGSQACAAPACWPRCCWPCRARANAGRTGRLRVRGAAQQLHQHRQDFGHGEVLLKVRSGERRCQAPTSSPWPRSRSTTRRAPTPGSTEYTFDTVKVTSPTTPTATTTHAGSPTTPRTSKEHRIVLVIKIWHNSRSCVEALHVTQTTPQHAAPGRRSSRGTASRAGQTSRANGRRGPPDAECS